MDFKVTDKRSSQRTGGLITNNVQAELSKARSIRGLGGPSHPARQAEYSQKAAETVRETGAFRSALNGMRTNSLMSEGESRVVDEMRANRRMSKTASDMVMALPKNREPLQTWKQMGIPLEIDSVQEREKIRMWARLFQRTHYLMATCIDIYTRFPVQGLELTCKDPEITRFYEELFLDQLNYSEFLVDFGREHWTVGEANSLASWNDVLGVWDDEEILNPDDLSVRVNPFAREQEYRIKVPEYLKKIIQSRSPKWEFELLEEQFPEIVQQVNSESFASETVDIDDEDELAWESAGLDVSNVLLSRIVNKTTPWDKYGTPHMMRAFRQLMQEESLNAAQDAVADRLYAPFIFAKLGLTDAGDGMPWIPDQGQIDAFRDDMNMALAADFRLMVHHFGVDIKSVFGREQMPRFDNDYDRLERKQLQVWGIGESLLSGSSNGSYASSALNRELVTQLMSTYQTALKRHFKKRAEIVAEAQEHFDYRSSGGVRTPIWEEVYEVDEEGYGHVRKRPKLLIPDLNFATMNLRDEATERQFLTTLKQQGVPISDGTLMVNIPFEFDEELEKVQQEKTKKVIAEAQFKERVQRALVAQGLDRFSPEEMAAGQTSTTEQAGGVVDEQTGIVYDDISSEPESPNLTPVTETPTGTGTTTVTPSEPVEESSTRLPRNQISQRPEISDEQRGRTARRVTRDDGEVEEITIDPRSSAGRLASGPPHIGARGYLTESSVEDAIQYRRWSLYTDDEYEE